MSNFDRRILRKKRNFSSWKLIPESEVEVKQGRLELQEPEKWRLEKEDSEEQRRRGQTGVLETLLLKQLQQVLVTSTHKKNPQYLLQEKNKSEKQINTQKNKAKMNCEGSRPE